ncbi:MAG TPA: heavy-metal-associated domain-containing protein [Anaerolineae bacterium]|nr:heavy-metal-associated domain-containing protein [Caldilineae bacterium]HID33969.1 heavy-metal-associated domain-containing protein [Anaerolineae bacterium]
MAEQMTYWTTLWVDSMDRHAWQERAKEALALDGVEEIQIDSQSGQVRVRYDFKQITPFHLHTHLRAAGL